MPPPDKVNEPLGKGIFPEGNIPFNPKNKRNYPDIDGYVIRDHIGSGSFAEVYRATPTIEPTKQVAIKILHPSHKYDENAIHSFHLEIEHHRKKLDGLVGFFDWKICKKGEFYLDSPYLILEYLPRGSLRKWMESEGHGDREVLKKAIQYLASACAGIAALHKERILHRDIKPENILLVDDRRVKFCDLGLARFIQSKKDLSAFRSTESLGTISYAAPEQIHNGKNATARSDIFSLGVILFEILHGHRPWHLPNETYDQERARILANLSNPVALPKEQGIDKQLQQLALRCIDPDPELRLQSVEELRICLEAWLDGKSIQLPNRFSINLWTTRWYRRIKDHPLLSQAIATAVALIMVFSLTAGSYYLAFVRPVSYFYAGLTHWEGIPVPTGSRIQSSEISRYAYRMTRHGYWGRLFEISLVQRDGNILDRAPLDNDPLAMLQNDPDLLIYNQVVPIALFRDRPVQWRYEYHRDGQIAKIEELDARSQVLQTRQFDDPHSAYFHEKQTGVSFSFEGIKPKTQRTTQVHRILYEWQNGLCSRIQFLASDGKPTRDTEGAFGWRYLRNDKGEIVEKQCLAFGKEGEIPGITNSGYSKLVIEMLGDEKIKYRFFNTEGNPVIDSRFDADEVEVSLDQYRHVEEIKFFAGGRAVRGQFSGPRIRIKWRDQKVLVEHYASTDLTKESIPSEILQGTYWNTGLLQRVDALDEKGELRAYLGATTSSLILDYGDNNITSLTLLNRTGQPSAEQTGASQLRLTWGADGVPTGMAAFHKDKPVMNLLGYHRTELRRDEIKRVDTLAFFDVENNRIQGPNGYHRSEIHYDVQGNIERMMFFDSLGGQAISKPKQYHRVEFRYDSRGNQESWAVFGRNDERVFDVEHKVHRVEMRYNEESQLKEYAYFGVDDLPMLHPDDGYYLVKRTYQAGQVASQAFFGVDRQPTIDAIKGYHELRIDRSPDKKTIAYSCFDKDGKRTIHRITGVHCEVHTMDQLGITTSIENFDVQNRAANCSEGWHLRKSIDGKASEYNY
ncbi:MAG: hypothetical protein RLY14_2373, partial [Planctomycetota bacterium]